MAPPLEMARAMTQGDLRGGLRPGGSEETPQSFAVTPCAGWVAVAFVLATTGAMGAALPGQVIVDPNNPMWLVYNRDIDGDGGLDPFYLCGPADPEGFLYRGTRNADGTRNGDQMELIDKLKREGGNAVYLIAVRTHGGDEGRDNNPGPPGSENPFIDSDPQKGLDDDILNQWETWFTAMDESGIVIFFIFYDDGTRLWNTGDTVGPEEKAFIHDLVNRFEHHKHLMWLHAEEYEERYTKARASRFAAEIRAADDYDHIIIQSQLRGLAFDFGDDPNFDQFGIQYNVCPLQTIHDGMVTAWNKAAGRYHLNMMENTCTQVSGAEWRKRYWAGALGGAACGMRLRMDIKSTAASDLDDCRRLTRFFESTNFNVMAPHDELAGGGTAYVLARPGESYIAYAPNLTGDIGLKNMTAGTYRFQWYDCVSGTRVVQDDVRVDAGDRTWRKPAGIGSELAVHIRRIVAAAANAAPLAIARSVTVQENAPVAITLAYSDLDGPGPYTFTVTRGPDHGSLSGTAPALTYLPEAGYRGPDSFSFTVGDGLATSAPATVSLQVEAALNRPPSAREKSVTVSQGETVYIQLDFDDPDGPGPYTYTIATPPSQGVLTGENNDRYYTPNPGFVGEDSLTWFVNDGLVNSDVVTVTIVVQTGQTTSPLGIAVTALQVGGRVNRTTATVTIAGIERPVDGMGNFLGTVPLNAGTTTIEITASNPAGVTTSRRLDSVQP